MAETANEPGDTGARERFEVILFDADGTLLDFERAESHALEAAFRDLGSPYRASYLDAYQEINREMWALLEQGRLTPEELRTERFVRFCESVGVGLDPAVLSARYLRRLGEGGYLIEHALEVVERIAPGRKLAIVTNGLSEVQRSRFARSGLDDYIEVLVISEEVGSQKPEPAIFERTFERLGRPSRERALIVGDSLTSDIQGGLNFGIATCWFRPNGAAAPGPGGPVPEFTIRDLRELIPLCESEITR